MQAGLIGVVGELDPAGLATASDEHLGLDHDGITELVGGRDGLVDGRRGTAVGHGNPVLGEELLSLVLEKVHQAALDPIGPAAETVVRPRRDAPEAPAS